MSFFINFIGPLNARYSLNFFIMKTTNRIKSTVITGVLAISIATVYYSCSKGKDQLTTGTGSASAASSQRTINANNFADKVSRIKFVGSDGKVIASINAKTGSFSFSDPHDGFHFSSPTGVQYVSANGGTIYVTAAAFGKNAGGGGAVVAGSSSLDIGYTLCFSAADSSKSSGFDFFGTGGGVSMVFGLSGDFDKLVNQKSGDSTKIQDMLHGFAIYIVYSDQASGKYDILDFTKDLSKTKAELNKKGFAFVADFQNLGIYFSKEGSLDVSGGSIGFEGKYYAFNPSKDSTNLFDLGKDAKVTEVDGSGTMGCN
jgi:hypothetical protein